MCHDHLTFTIVSSPGSAFPTSHSHSTYSKVLTFILPPCESLTSQTWVKSYNPLILPPGEHLCHGIVLASPFICLPR